MSWARGLGALLGCRTNDPIPTRSGSSSSDTRSSSRGANHSSGTEHHSSGRAHHSSSTTEHSYEDEDVHEDHDEIGTSQIPDAPPPSQLEESFERRERRERRRFSHSDYDKPRNVDAKASKKMPRRK